MKQRYLACSCLVAVLISGVASAGITIGGTSITFDDGTTQDSAAVVYTRIVVVPADGTDTANGTALLNALSGITTASSGNRFLLQLEPGNYDLASDPLTMKAFVDLQGSGMTSSTIISSSNNWTVRLVSNTQIRHVELIQNGSISTCVALGISVTNCSLYRVRLENTTPDGNNDTFLISDSDATLTLTEHHLVTTNSGISRGIGVTNSTLRTDLVQVFVANAATSIGIEITTAGGAANMVLNLIEINVEDGASGTGILLVNIFGDGPTGFVVNSNVTAGVPLAANNFDFGAINTGLFGASGSTGLTNTGFVGCYTLNGSGNWAPITDTDTAVAP